MNDGTIELQPQAIEFWSDLSRDFPEAAKARLLGLFEQLEPSIQAFVPEEERDLRLSCEIDRVADEDSVSGPLVGVPIGVKDIIHVEGFETRAGSSLPAEAPQMQGPEAEAVTLLKQAGGFVAGKTVSTEFAYFAPGPTRNPHDPQRTPGGSSSGSAAAVAAGLCPVALGTQTIGSISRPASYCGVVGFKPSLGRISTAGVIPLSLTFDHLGTFATTARDTRTVAALLCKRWSRRESPSMPRLGVPMGPYLERASQEAFDQFETAIRCLEEHGYTILEIEAFDDLDTIVDNHYTIVAAEAARQHREWYSHYGDRYHDKTRELIERGLKISDEDLVARRSSIERVRHNLLSSMAENDIDLWISPAAPGPAPEGLEATGDPIMNLPWSHAGVPTLTLPAGRGVSGLPIGLQIAGAWWRDEDLLEWGIEIEEALP